MRTPAPLSTLPRTLQRPVWFLDGIAKGAFGFRRTPANAALRKFWLITTGSFRRVSPR